MANEKNNEEKKYLTEREVLASGAVLKEYTQTDFIAVSPAPAIGRVKFSIVKQGTNGKDHADFYLGMEAFRLLCIDLCSTSGIKKLNESADHQYPDAYKMTSGTDGSKHLNIGGGKKGIRIQIQAKKGEKWDNRLVIVPFDSIRSMRFRFELVMGLIPTQEGSYYRSLYDAFWAGEEQRAKYYRSSYDEAGDGDYRPDQETAPTGNDTPAPAAQKEQAKPVQESPKQEKANNKPAEETKPVGTKPADKENKGEPEVLIYTVQTLGPVKRSGNTYYCPVKIAGTETTYNLCFVADYLPNMGDKWEMFQEKAADGVKIRIRGQIVDGKMKFIDIDK